MICPAGSRWCTIWVSRTIKGMPAAATATRALTCAIASENGFDCFTTSLLYSRHQQHDAIRGIGTRVAASGDYRTNAGFGSEFLYRDFRPLWQAGIDRSKEMGLYRQNYCACIFSEYERFEKKLRKLSAE